RIRVVNRGPEPAPIHVLPMLWYRNTWSWRDSAERFAIERDVSGSARTRHPAIGERFWYVTTDADAAPELLFTDNDTNVERLYGVPNAGAHVKDGINDAVVDGRFDRVSAERGSKAAAHVRTLLAPGAQIEVWVRLSPRPVPQPFADFDASIAARRR